jgi:hypothetical protein
MPRERATATASAPLEFAVVAGLLLNLAVTADTLVVTARRQAAGGADVVLTRAGCALSAHAITKPQALTTYGDRWPVLVLDL